VTVGLPVLISLCLSLSTFSLFAKHEEFAERRTLPPLKLTATDLDTVLRETQALIASANGSLTESDSARESVKLGVRGHEIEIPHFSLASSVAFPREVFRFSYSYRRPDKPISSVTIDFGDCSRHLLVSGDSAKQVEAITIVLEKDLLRYSAAIGGKTFRRVVGLCLCLGLLATVGASGAYWWRTRASNALGMLICSAIGLLLILLVPWNRYLPGFVLYQSYSPFPLIRYAPQIFSLILVVSLLGIPLSYFFLRRKS